MKNTNRSWRAQKGSRVAYATDRFSGEAIVRRVLQAPLLGIGDGSGRYLVRDIRTGVERETTGEQMRFPDKR